MTTYFKKLPEYINIETDNITGRVLSSDYVTAKTKDLIEFGYKELTEHEVSQQVLKVLNRDLDLSIIGRFVQSDNITESE